MNDTFLGTFLCHASACHFGNAVGKFGLPRNFSGVDYKNGNLMLLVRDPESNFPTLSL